MLCFVIHLNNVKYFSNFFKMLRLIGRRILDVSKAKFLLPIIALTIIYFI